MKLAVSNIAWNQEEDAQITDLLRQLGVNGIEIAPTRIWPSWNGASAGTAASVAEEFKSAGFSIPALQAILFDKPDLRVFGSQESQSALLEHLALVADLAEALGAKTLVFGSPKNRDRGNLSQQQAFESAAQFFVQAGEICHQRGVQLGLEPNPTVYQCNFMTRWQEILEMVEEVAHPGIGVHLDTACISLEGDDVVAAINACEGKICHFHVTEKNLGDFANPEIDHGLIGKALKDSGYDRWISIEMRRSENPQKSITEAVRYVTGYYL
jgi:D-psicose/D-tagatose/L-ribulose 3-epimerase